MSDLAHFLFFLVAACIALSALTFALAVLVGVRYWISDKRHGRATSLSPHVPLQPVRDTWDWPATELDYARERREARNLTGGAA
jgi:hypothetical protein